MLIRFSLPFLHTDSARPVGIFRGTGRLLREGRFDEGLMDWLDEERDWFGRHLVAPWFEDPRAVFWFRDSAGRVLTRIWGLVRIIESHGVPVIVHRTRRPGIVVYQDQHQVAAVPWHDTFDRVSVPARRRA